MQRNTARPTVIDLPRSAVNVRPAVRALRPIAPRSPARPLPLRSLPKASNIIRKRSEVWAPALDVPQAQPRQPRPVKRTVRVKVKATRTASPAPQAPASKPGPVAELVGLCGGSENRHRTGLACRGRGTQVFG